MSKILISFYDPPAAEVDSIYGNPWAIDGLANTTLIGGRTVAQRFKAPATKTLSTIRFYNIHTAIDGDYSDGDGGNIYVSLQPDDGTANRYPDFSTTVLDDCPTITTARDDPFFPLLSWNTGYEIQEGTYYHICYSNTAADPTNNYVSIDSSAWNNPSYPWPPRGDPDYPDYPGSFGVMFSNQAYPPTSWTARYPEFDGDTPGGGSDTHQPIFDLGFTDGSHYGHGYMEAGVPSRYTNSRVEGTNNLIRERFTVTGGDRTVSAFAVRFVRSGSSDLSWRLETGAGSEIESGTIDAAEFLAVSGSINGNMQWVDVSFASNHTLSNGQTYNMQFSCSSGTIYYMTAPRDGNAAGYGFNGDTVFSDGRAEYTEDGGSTWKGWYYWGVDDRSDYDLSLYFTVV